MTRKKKPEMRQHPRLSLNPESKPINDEIPEKFI